MGRGNPVAVPVELEAIPLWKDKLDWHFRSFSRGGLTTPETLWNEIENNERRLWVVWDDEPLGALLTSFHSETKKALIVTHAAGKDRKLWLPLWVVLEAFARQTECDRIEVHCRAGWEADLKNLGLRKTHVLMEKTLG